MKQYKVLALSLSTHLGLTFKQGSIIAEHQLHGDHIADLLKQKAIEEYKEPEDTKKKK